MTPSETAQELEVGNVTTTPHHLVKGNPSFRLVITGAKKSSSLCRSLLSAAVLDYPPPTLINYDDGSEDSQSRLHDAKKVHEYLQGDTSSLTDDDVVLVAEGDSTIFQLPASVLLHRLETTQAFANDEPDDLKAQSQQLVYLGASDLCALGNKHEACAHLPDPDTKAHSLKMSRAKFVDGGVAIGRVPDMKKLFMASSGSIGQDGIKDSKGILTKLFAEQELSRQAKKSRESGYRSGWKAFMDHKPWGYSDSESPTVNGRLPRDREFGMALDYHSSMFFSASHHTPNMSFTRDGLNRTGQSGAALPTDILTSPAPISPVPITYVDESHNSSALPLNTTIDRLNGEIGWQDLPLAVDDLTDSIPAIIHFEYPEDHKHQSWPLWRSMWFHPFARALMRNHLRSSEGPAALQAAAMGGDREFDTRGGKGGFWTESGVWLGFGEVCRGYEDELFGDGYGEWGLEGGGHPRCDINGALFSGEGDCKEIKEEEERDKSKERRRHLRRFLHD